MMARLTRTQPGRMLQTSSLATASRANVAAVTVTVVSVGSVVSVVMEPLKTAQTPPL
jgi:hypothetical protein